MLPAGSVIAWVAGSAPTGWLLCQGQAISRSTYAALFAVCSTDYGSGDGSSTFNVPDLRGRTVTMAGTNINRAGSTAEFGTGVTATTASGSASLTTGSVSVSAGAKDAGATTVLNSVSSTGHTHSVVIPTTTLMYIIKT